MFSAPSFLGAGFTIKTINDEYLGALLAIDPKRSGQTAQADTGTCKTAKAAGPGLAKVAHAR